MNQLVLCMYLSVSGFVCLYLMYQLLSCVYLTVICMYLHILVSICMCLLVSCMYLHVLHIFPPEDTEIAATSSEHLAVGRHPAGCTLGIPGRVHLHFISQSEFYAETLFCAPLHAASV